MCFFLSFLCLRIKVVFVVLMRTEVRELGGEV